MKLHCFILSIIISLVFLSCETEKDQRPFGTLIEVPNEVPSIQEAINIAQNFDTILLHPGEYFENNIKIDKPLFITSLYSQSKDTSVIRQTIVNANYISRAFFIQNVPDTTRMNGFTVKEGRAYDNSNIIDDTEWLGGGIYCKGSNLFLTNMVLDQNSAFAPNARGSGGALYCENSFIEIDYTIIRNNIALTTGGGIHCLNSRFNFYNSKLENNTCAYMGSQVEYFSSSTIGLKSILIKDKPGFGGVTGQDPYIVNVFSCTGYMDHVISYNRFDFIGSQITQTNCILP